ncbi:MAG: TVP38/TMEM64 family protein [Candidatus Aureabacteria bacterium]|nr:TVP38/TMEM64 family protein [Candidatus Auribacterota bacterium]
MKWIKKSWVKLLLALSLIAIVFILFRVFDIDFSNVSEEEFKNWVEGMGVWGPIVYIIVYLLRPLILFPAGVLSAAAGIIWGTWLGFFYLQIAANISSTAEFLFARYFARNAIEKKFGERIKALDEKIEKHGFLTVLLIRLIPNVAWDIQNLSLGLTKVSFRDYFIATLIGIMPGSFAFVFFGSSLIKVLFDPKNIVYIIIAVLVFVGVYFLQKFLRKKHSQDSANDSQKTSGGN